MSSQSTVSSGYLSSQTLSFRDNLSLSIEKINEMFMKYFPPCHADSAASSLSYAKCKSFEIIRGEGFNKIPVIIETIDNNKYVLLLWSDIDGLRCRNYVNVVNLVKTHTKIPVPHVFISDDSPSKSYFSPLTFALVTFVNGQKLKKLLTDNIFNTETKKDIAKQLASYLGEMQKLTFNKVGGFTFPINSSNTGVTISSLSVGIDPMFYSKEVKEMAISMKQNQGPFNNVWEYYTSCILVWSSLLEQSPDTRVNTIYSFCNLFATKILQQRQIDAKIALVQGDFGDDNIFADADTGKITGVLDWDGAHAGPLEADMCAIRKISFSHTKLKEIDKDYKEEKSIVDFFNNELSKQCLITPSIIPREIQEVSWLLRLLVALVGWRGWFDINDEEKAIKFYEQQLIMAFNHIAELKRKYNLS